MLKKIIFFSILFFLLSGPIFAQESILIINQVRGNESCCQAGNDKLIQAVLNNNKIKNLSYGWAIRSDVLEDEKIIGLLQNKGELGLLLEVTPRLALAAGVEYRGRADGSDWYYAKNAFLIGYTKEERKKLIDQFFTQFKNKLGFYPSFTTGWMIDSWSLDYIHNQYGVKLHELTKEQYETDSYTLYGGVFNAPYYPSSGHPLVPGLGSNKLDLVIVRQTVSDLLRNYGSPIARYTSQPNDYLGSVEGLNISYFHKLIDDVTAQPSEFRFGVLGFENSYSFAKYGNEYLAQLGYIADLQTQGKVKIVKPSEYASEYKSKYQENPAFFLQKDFTPEKKSGVLWYFGNTYRARLLLKDGKIILDDLRIYANIKDPYQDTPATADYSYWVVPYLIDGSQQYQSSGKKPDKKYRELIGGNTVPDFLTDPFGIVLGKGNFKLNSDDTSIEIEFNGENQGKIKFLPQEINIGLSLNPSFNFPAALKIEEIINTSKKTVFPFAKHFDFVVKSDKDGTLLGWERDGSMIDLAKIIIENEYLKLIPKTEQNNISKLDPIFQQDRSGLSVDSRKSIFYWNNKTAVAGRNPVRLFILPLNNLGRPSQVKKIEVVSPDINNLEVIYPDDYSYRIKPWFIDITARKPIETKVTIIVDGVNVAVNVPVEFAFDCQKDMGMCMRQPVNLIKYIKIFLGEQQLKAVQFLKSKFSAL